MTDQQQTFDLPAEPIGQFIEEPAEQKKEGYSNWFIALCVLILFIMIYFFWPSSGGSGGGSGNIITGATGVAATVIGGTVGAIKGVASVAKSDEVKTAVNKTGQGLTVAGTETGKGIVVAGKETGKVLDKGLGKDSKIATSAKKTFSKDTGKSIKKAFKF